MKYRTTRFSEIEVSDEKIITAPDGLLGFSDCVSWTLMDEERAAPFRMLQSLDNPALAFVIVDPLFVYPDYQFDVTIDDVKKLCGDKQIQLNTDGLETYCMVNLRKQKIVETTINLQGPLVLNPTTRLLHQFVLIDTEYTTRMPFLREKGLF